MCYTYSTMLHSIGNLFAEIQTEVHEREAEEKGSDPKKGGNNNIKNAKGEEMVAATTATAARLERQ